MLWAQMWREAVVVIRLEDWWSTVSGRRSMRAVAVPITSSSWGARDMVACDSEGERRRKFIFFCRINSNNNTSDNFVAGYQRGIHDVIKFRNSEMLDVYLKWTNVSWNTISRQFLCRDVGTLVHNSTHGNSSQAYVSLQRYIAATWYTSKTAAVANVSRMTSLSPRAYSKRHF